MIDLGQTSKYEDSDEKSLNQLADEAATKDHDAASSNGESLYDVTSGLSMLPKVQVVHVHNLSHVLIAFQSNPIFIVKTQLTERSRITDKHRENYI